MTRSPFWTSYQSSRSFGSSFGSLRPCRLARDSLRAESRSAFVLLNLLTAIIIQQARAYTSKLDTLSLIPEFQYLANTWTSWTQSVQALEMASQDEAAQVALLQQRRERDLPLATAF